MKKIILFAAILFAGVSVVNAQGQIEKYKGAEITQHTSVTEGTKEAASTKVTVQLNSIQSISVNTSNISLEYTTVEDYKKGVRSGVIENHLEVYSTGAYAVKVNYSDASDNGYDGPDAGLNADAMFQSINLAVTAKEGVSVNNSKLEKVSTGAIISSTKGGFGDTFDIDYQGAANYMNSIKGGKTRTYTANVVYTIIAS